MFVTYRFTAAATLVLLLWGTGRAAHPHYRCLILPGSFEANGVNNLGEVVGRTAPYGEPGEAFYYQAGRTITFGSGEMVTAFSISDSGHIAGMTEVGGIGRAMMADRTGGFSALEDGGAFWSEAYAINDHMQAVGYTDGTDGWNRAALWDAGSYGDISGGQDRNSQAYGINDLGEVVGWDQNVAVFFDPDPSPMGAPGPRSAARSISDSGYVTGTSFDNVNRTWSAWFYDGSEFQIIATGPSGTTYAWDVNDLGQVVGTANGEAFLWEDGTYYSLSALIGEGAGTLYEARSINDCGVIVGYAGEGAFLLIPIDSTDFTDSDGDGLLDRWERCGLDLDMDGVSEYHPPDADPDHADLYVELDHAASAPLQPEVAAELEAAFAAVPLTDLPVANPDGRPGITLHLLVDDTAVTETGDIDIGAEPYQFPPVFDMIKEDFFGTEAERTDPDSEKILEAKRHVYHYGIMIGGLRAEMPDHSIEYVSGMAECFGNDFMIATSAFRFPPGSWQDQAGTILHELGHNLGLEHGGGDDVNFKANYFSVMNYAWQMPHPGVSLEWKLDFSHSASNPTVYEGSLDEPDGFQGVTREGEVVPVFYAVNGDPNRVALAWTNTAPLDFDGDGGIDPSPVAEDINHVDASLPASPTERHYDFDDWAALRLDFRSSPAFPDGVHDGCAGAGSLEISRGIIERLASIPPPSSTGIADPTAVPAPQGLTVVPNPSRGITRIRFALPEAGTVSLTIFDAGGRRVRTLLDTIREPGTVTAEWDGRDDRGAPVSEGMYFVAVRTQRGLVSARVLRRS